ncbi:hypothetical protein ABTC44_17305, partial [Acinetobacter baumannii]
WCRLIHLKIILWNKPLEIGLCNKALDEPENHLDIESRELFANAISSYEGAVLLVSHDLSFVEKCGIVDSIYLN